MSKTSPPSWWSSPSASLRYAMAALSVVAAVVGGLLLDRFLDTAPFVSLFLCAIMFASWFGGVGPGLLATALSIFAFNYYFLPPMYSVAVAFKDLPRLLLFAITALFVVALNAVQRRTAGSLERTRDDLQTAVRELERLNASLQVENTERRRAEQTIRHAERELQLTIDTIPALAARYRRDGSLDFVNRTWRDYTGLSQDSLTGQRWGVAIHPDDLALVERAWRSHLPTGEPFEMEQRLRRADGEYRRFWVRRVPLRDESGTVIKWYGVGHDIEDQKRAESALRRSEAYLAEAQRLSVTGSFGWKIASGDIFWSDETYRILGVDRAVKPTIDVILQCVHPDDREFVRREIDRAAQGEQDYDHEHRLLMSSGDVKHLHVRAHRLKYESGEEEIVGALMDVTATRQAQEALHSAQAELAHVTRVTTLGEMSASIAHEVNQPLAAIVTNGEASLRWLDRGTPEIDEALDAIRHIVSEAHRASGVIRGIREFSRKAEPEMVRLDVNGVIDEVVTLVQREALRHGVTMRLQPGSRLPMVRGDRIQLQQVIINLVINAIQAMATVTDRERVLFLRTQRHEPDHVLVAVEDVGVGIEPGEADRLFNAFYTTKPDGLGMGLSICRSIIETHGGQVWASRNIGPGMTFQFTISAHEQA
ncbi:MAG: PAS domain-containing protein [Xanthobacteraceae bacterium]